MRPPSLTFDTSAELIGISLSEFTRERNKKRMGRMGLDRGEWMFRERRVGPGLLSMKFNYRDKLRD